MFTGIIEEIGVVKNFSRHAHGALLTVGCGKVLQDTIQGDSISVNGVCQTVISLTVDGFTVDISDETLSVTTFDNLKPGDKVNLERALTLSKRLGGHIVSGHVDCKGKFLSAQKLTNFYNLTFELPQEQVKYVVNKGSISVNGISLTVAAIDGVIFKTAIIPHTYENTTLSELQPGDYVNIETDILAKYIEKISQADDNKGISLEFLQENGFV